VGYNLWKAGKIMALTDVGIRNAKAGAKATKLADGGGMFLLVTPAGGILDNLPAHKSEKAKMILKQRGAWFLFLLPYSPDLNPIEMAFAKLKAHLRSAKARTIDALWQAVGNICDLYSPDECYNYLKHAGYVAD
jgi:hypothetical protein